MDKFSIEKNIFGQDVFFHKNNKAFKVCTLKYLQDQEEIEIRTPFFERKSHKIPVFVEVQFEMDRNSSIIYHEVNIPENTLLFKDIQDFNELKIGKTHPKIKRHLATKKRYDEIFTKCKSSGRTIYFFIRHLEEYKLDSMEYPIPDKPTDNILIGAYLYDPKAEEDNVFEPLTLIYCTKVYLENFDEYSY